MRIVERAVVAAKREGVIVADEYKEEGSVAGAAHEALTQVMGKALGLNVGGKIGIARQQCGRGGVFRHRPSAPQRGRRRAGPPRDMTKKEFARI